MTVVTYTASCYTQQPSNNVRAYEKGGQDKTTEQDLLQIGWQFDSPVQLG